MRALIKKTVLLMAFAVLALAAWLYWYPGMKLDLEQPEYELELRHGSSLRGVARQLVEAGLLPEPWSFVTLVRLHGKAGEIKAGNYLLRRGMTVNELYLMLTSGRTVQSSITLIEGWTFRQVRQALYAHEDLKHLTIPMTDAEILQRIGASESMAEGLFFPDSYFFDRGMSDLEILQRAYRTMQSRLESAWQSRAPGLPYRNPYQALIMASIVEKETGRSSERPMIARVFLNRLRLGMKLQTDPTVIYGLGEAFDGNLRKRDLLADTPYNTYTRYGLPPTPIAMPGMAAIEAALHPASSDALYFVGKGDGSHVFSATLGAHNQAVNRYQRKGR